MCPFQGDLINVVLCHTLQQASDPAGGRRTGIPVGTSGRERFSTYEVASLHKTHRENMMDRILRCQTATRLEGGVLSRAMVPRRQITALPGSLVPPMDLLLRAERSYLFTKVSRRCAQLSILSSSRAFHPPPPPSSENSPHLRPDPDHVTQLTSTSAMSQLFPMPSNSCPYGCPLLAPISSCSTLHLLTFLS
jgi:hypothetical protein